MRKTSVAILSVAALVFLTVGTSSFAKTPACQRTNVAAFVWSQCAGGTVWIVETTRPLAPFHFEGTVPPLRQHATTVANEFALVFNGAYHDGNYAKAKLEGLHVFDGKKLSELKLEDRQLTHVLSIDRSGRIDSIREATYELQATLNADTSRLSTHIQSGPLILDNGKLAKPFIEGSLNGNDAYKRTAIGVTRAGETVIVIAKTPRTLADLASIVLATNDYAKRGLTLLNLDGGPSTAIHSADVRGLSYGADKITPVGFGVRK
jgi:uncharacterized protein YigE (DUF2233 family)